ncbi:MAG: hypothetical protein QXJ97_10560 [Desulfurococcaceae archaeon]
MRKLNLLIDFICELGSTSRLIKFFKERNILLRQISYDLTRLRVSYDLNREQEHTLLSNVSNILTLVDNTRNLWKTCCIEVWVEENTNTRIKESKLSKIGELCTYVRPGRRNSLISKLTWIDQCNWPTGTPIPESITRKCIDNTYDINNIEKRIIDFIVKVKIKEDEKPR